MKRISRIGFFITVFLTLVLLGISMMGCSTTDQGAPNDVFDTLKAKPDSVNAPTPSPTPSSTWYSSYAYDYGQGVGYTFVSVTNVSGATVTATTSFYDSEGNLIKKVDQPIPTKETESGGASLSEDLPPTSLVVLFNGNGKNFPTVLITYEDGSTTTIPMYQDD